MADASNRYAPDPAKIAHVRLELGGRQFDLLPPDLDGTRRLRALGARVEKARKRARGDPSFALMTTFVAEALQLALVRNYPDITIADVRRLLDLENAQRALQAVLEMCQVATPPAKRAGEKGVH